VRPTAIDFYRLPLMTHGLLNHRSRFEQRKLEHHAAAAALNYFAYNFIKIHRTGLSLSKLFVQRFANGIVFVGHIASHGLCSLLLSQSVT
jgi:hypothetical protein